MTLYTRMCVCYLTLHMRSLPFDLCKGAYIDHSNVAMTLVAATMMYRWLVIWLGGSVVCTVLLLALLCWID